MADTAREERFVKSMNSWGYVFMMTGWIQSAMVSAIAARKNPDSRSREYLN